GGYLCQPRSSSTTGALTRSKLPRPEIVVVTVIGSPTCTLLGFASVVITKFPIAPEKLGGAFGGNGFTSSATGSLLISTSRRSPIWANGLLKNGSEKGSSRSKPNGERERGALRLRGTMTCAFALTGPTSNFPARAAAIAVLYVTTSYCLRWNRESTVPERQDCVIVRDARTSREIVYFELSRLPGRVNFQTVD